MLGPASATPSLAHAPDPAPAAPAVPVQGWRVALVLALAGVLVFGHVYDMAVLREHWPFSYYPMYGRAQKKPQLQTLALILISPVSKTKTTGIRVTSDTNFVPAVSESRIRNILIASWGRDGTAPKAVRNTGQILYDYLKLYEARRILGLHDGPPAVEAQLRRLTYRVRQDTAAQKAIRDEPLLGARANGNVVLYDPLLRAGRSAVGAPGTQPAPIASPSGGSEDDSDH